VHGLGRNAADSAVVQALAYLGHELGLEVVAEGVETRRAWDLALELGCDLAQGFYMAPPSTREALIEWLNSGWPAAAELPVGATTHLALDLHTRARAAARVPTKPG
jgi:EAL domain-containing protein (putative c-di-GMP-specific phosphodiesterase class I)